MITHGRISRVLVFLGDILRGRISSLHEFQLLHHCSPDDRLWVEDFCDRCKLTRLTNGARDVISEKGKEIALNYQASHNLEIAFRDILHEYICEARPAWANRIPTGREEAFVCMNKDELFCFKEAGLACVPVTNSIVAWWDEVASKFRSQSDSDLVEVGRMGERLTIAYEFERTGQSPSWVAVESNFAGYDILSLENKSSAEKRLIEVKSTRKTNADAEFYISRNEWDTALTCIEHYYFYLWRLGEKNRLTIVTASEMQSHVAKNLGSGRWVSVAIPFETF